MKSKTELVKISVTVPPLDELSVLVTGGDSVLVSTADAVVGTEICSVAVIPLNEVSVLVTGGDNVLVLIPDVIGGGRLGPVAVIPLDTV